jgi:hypothetical protein
MGRRDTGQRAAKAVKKRWGDDDGAPINVVQQKTGEKVSLHGPAALSTMRGAMPRRHARILTNKGGGKIGKFDLC